MKSRKWLWAFALLPLVCLPLIAQESTTGDPGAPKQEETPAPQAGSSPTEQQPQPAAPEEPEPPEERVSADNNLSFPVDI